MLPASLGRDINNRSFEQFQQTLLNSFARYITGDGRVIAFSGDLIYFINKDYPFFCCFNIIIGILKKPCEQTFYVFTHITCLRKYCRIDDSKRYMQHPGYRSCQECLPCTCLSNKDDIRFFNFNILRIGFLHQPFIMVIDCYGYNLFSHILTNYILVEEVFYFDRFEKINS